MVLIDVWREAERLSSHIETVEPGTDEYDNVLRQIENLVRIENQILERSEFDSKLDKFLKNQALVGGVFSLIATLAILNYERLDIVTSRAFGWIRFK